MSALAANSNPNMQRISAHRDRLAELRLQARSRHEKGTNSLQIVSFLSAGVDDVVLQLMEEATAGLPEEIRADLPRQLAVVAVGGTGRGELAPYSDVDLLFLNSGRSAALPVIQQVVSQVVRDCWDIGMKLGHSSRNLAECLSLAQQDIEAATALVEARLLWGSDKLVADLQRNFHRSAIRPRLAGFLQDCLKAREEESQKHGGTVQQLEPDIKCSPGGLRDLHLLRWVAFACHKTTDLTILRMHGLLSQQEVQELREAHQFLMDLRLELHFHAAKPQELLSRDEQLRLAEKRNIEAPPGQRPVERFMQVYFQHTTRIAKIVRRFVTRQIPRSWTGAAYQYLLTHRSNEVFRVGPQTIEIPRRHRRTMLRGLESILELYQLAGLYRVLPTTGLSDALHEAAEELPTLSSAKEAELLLDIFRRGSQLGPILRNMFDTGILDKVIPEFSHTRCLLQFNQYHAYTVDEHSLRAVEALTSYESDPGSIGEAYRQVRHKEILHLAMLLHDAGKGYTEDHSEVGRRLAITVGERLRLPQYLQEILVFLVHKHLLLSELAFRRNLADPEVYLPVSRAVGTPEVLRMLYVLTAADLMAVGPQTWTSWKGGLLQELYERAMEVVTGESYRPREKEQLVQLRQATLRELEPDFTREEAPLSRDWAEETWDTLPRHTRLSSTPVDLAVILRLIGQLHEQAVFVHSQFLPETRTVEYRVVAPELVSAGCFSKMAGALTAKRLEILSAEIATSTTGVVLDRFRVVDYDFSGEVPESRREEVANTIRDVLLKRVTVEQLFANNRRFEGRTGAIVEMPTQVRIDNDSSDRFTIIDVFTHDKTGLLYVITHALFELELSVCLAKIGTHLDQVVDVFYVTDSQGAKLHGQRLGTIRDTLESRIDTFRREGLLSPAS